MRRDLGIEELEGYLVRCMSGKYMSNSFASQPAIQQS